MKTRVVNGLRTGGIAVPIGPDPTQAGYTRSFVPPYQHDTAAPGGAPGMAPQSLGLAAPAKKYPKIGQVTPGQGGLAVDPRMAAAGAYAKANGITSAIYNGATPFGHMGAPTPGGSPDYNAPLPWGHMGAPLDFHQQRPSLGLAAPAPQVAPPVSTPRSLGLAAPVPQTHGLYPGVDVPQAQHLEAQGGLAPPTSLGLAHPNPRWNPNNSPESKAIEAKFPPLAPNPRIAAANQRISKAGETITDESLFGPTVSADIAKARGIAQQNNGRESMLAGLNNRPAGGKLPTAAERNAPGGDPALAERKLLAKGYENMGGTFVPSHLLFGHGLDPNVGVAKANLNLALDRRHNGFEPSPGGMSPQEQYDMRQFDKLKAARQLFGDRATGKAQTPRQVRMLARAEAQKQQFEQGLGLASPNAYASMKDSAARIAAANAAQESNERIQMDRNKATRDVAGTAAKTAATKQYMDAYTELVKGGMSHADILRHLGPPPGSTASPTAASPASTPTPTPPPRVAGSAPPTAPITPTATPVPPPNPFHSPVAAAAAPVSLFSPPATKAARNRQGAAEYDKTYGRIPYKPQNDLADAQRAQIAKENFAGREALMNQFGVTNKGDRAYYHQLGNGNDTPNALWEGGKAIGASALGLVGVGRPRGSARPTRKPGIGGRSVPMSKGDQNAKERDAIRKARSGPGQKLFDEI